MINNFFFFLKIMQGISNKNYYSTNFLYLILLLSAFLYAHGRKCFFPLLSLFSISFLPLPLFFWFKKGFAQKCFLGYKTSTPPTRFSPFLLRFCICTSIRCRLRHKNQGVLLKFFFEERYLSRG